VFRGIRSCVAQPPPVAAPIQSASVLRAIVAKVVCPLPRRIQAQPQHWKMSTLKKNYLKVKTL
jgi:hypothetical protein